MIHNRKWIGLKNLLVKVLSDNIENETQDNMGLQEQAISTEVEKQCSNYLWLEMNYKGIGDPLFENKV